MDTPDNEQTLSTLNSLIETLKDGEKGYQQAADEAQDADLKSLFGQYVGQRHEFAKALQKAAYELGDAKPENSSSVASSIHRGWINLKAALTNQDRHAILAECESGEDSAKKAYNQALSESGLTPAVRSVVEEQQAAILEAHNTIKKLRDESAAIGN